MSAKAIHEYEREIEELKQEVARLQIKLDVMAQVYQGRTHFNEENE